MPPIKQPRASKRMARNHSAWIVVDGDAQRHECRVINLSADGVQLVADVDALVGSAVRLFSEPNASKLRNGTVVWRRGRKIGVQLLG